MKVEQILADKGGAVFAVVDTDAIADAVSVLNDKNIGAVVVRNEKGGVVGILSERDIVRGLGKNGGDALGLKVRDCMTPDPFTCCPDDTVDTLMGQMTDKRIRHLPVIRDGDLIGVVSIGDVVKRKIEETEQEARVLKEYIAG